MSTPTSVTSTLQDVVRRDLAIKASIHDINNSDGPVETLQKINADARRNVQEIKKALDDLELFAKERDREDEKKEILREVESQRRQLENTISSLRRANLQCQLRIEQVARGGLMTTTTTTASGGDSTSGANLRHRSAAESSPSTKKKTVDKERLVNSVSEVTDGMMELSRKLNMQVEHSFAAVETLVSSSKNLQESHDEVQNMDAHINTSKKLLTKFERRQLTDHLLIFLALVFFYASVIYIVKKRLWPSGGGGGGGGAEDSVLDSA